MKHLPFVVHSGRILEPLATFQFRADALRYAKAETLPRLNGETGFPILGIEGPQGEKIAVMNGDVVKKHAGFGEVRST